jgi:starch-binding outer membrane protein, SusD/RagB family
MGSWNDMMKTHIPTSRWKSRKALVPPLALLTTLAGCSLDSILDVTDPDVVTPEMARDPQNLSGLRFGAIGDFQIAYAGSGPGNGTEGVILTSGLLGDELYVGDTFGTRQEVDQRRITPQNAGLLTVFRNLHRARRAAEVAAEVYAANPEHERYSAVGHAEVTNIAAYVYTMLAENYCSGVPFSRVTEDNRLEHGEQWTTRQMLDHALDRFRAARGLSTNAAQVNLARVGEGRALLGMGDRAGAAAAVANVPTNFVYMVEYSENTATQNNGVWFITHSRRGYGVAHNEGGNGLPYRQGSSQSLASQDPRVPYTRTNLRATDLPFAYFFQLRYPTRGTPVPLATGVEARLIEAEAALNAGASADYLPILNALRANAASLLVGMGMTPPAGGFAPLAPLTDPGTAAGRVDQFFQERAFWLFLTGQRLSDQRRLMRQYGRTEAGAGFPTGPYRRLAYATASVPDSQLEYRVSTFNYGTDVNLPIPFDEQNNPNFSQCLNRDP